MTLYITKNGQQLGPYSLEETRGYVQTGVLSPADLTWYEGLTTWIPLAQVPGFGAQPPGYAAVDGPRERPVMVWVISIFYFIGTFFGLISVALLPLLAHLPNMPEAQQRYFDSQTGLDYGIMILGMLLNLTGAILLFMLKRPALYFFAGVLAFGIVQLIYQIVAKNWLQVVFGSVPGMVGAIFGICIGWGINIAILCYVWHLARTKVLR